MNLDELKAKAELTALAYFDTYCGTGYCLMSEGLLSSLKKGDNNHEVMSALIEGMMAGMKRAVQDCEAGSKNRRNPLDSILPVAEPKVVNKNQCRHCGAVEENPAIHWHPGICWKCFDKGLPVVAG